jgi:hypothetical protein
MSHGPSGLGGVTTLHPAPTIEITIIMVAGIMRANARTTKRRFFFFFMFYSPGFLTVNDEVLNRFIYTKHSNYNK